MQPRSVRAICALHEIGIFPADALAPGQTAIDRLINDNVLPFKYDNRLFPIVSLLSSIQYWYGCLTFNNNRQPYLQLNRKQVDSAVIQLTEGLLRHNPHCTDFQLFLDAIHARFLQALGTAAGRKTAAPLVLPHPIELALNTLAETNKADKTEIDLARASVRDFICSLFYTGKVTHTESRGYSMAMPSSHNPDIAATRSKLLLRSFEEARIPCEIRVQATSQTSGADRVRLHSAIFHLRGIDDFNVKRFATEIRGRIQEVLPLSSANKSE